MVLANGHLKYYADKHSQDEAIIKGSMDMSTVTVIEDCCEEDGRKYIQVSVALSLYIFSLLCGRKQMSLTIINFPDHFWP